MHTPRVRALLIGFLTVLLAFSGAANAANESQSFRFEIPAGPLNVTLTAFEAVTGAKVSVDPAITSHLSSPGVSGVFTTALALEQLLSGTGLTARLTAANTFALEFWISPESIEVTASSAPYRAETSASATKTLTPLRDIPQTVNVVPRELLIDQSAQSIAGALKNVVGVTVAQGEGNRDQIVLRGINTNSDFFVNGIRDDQERFRDLYNVESLEVVQGPAAVLFGRGGAGGVVNVVTHSPLAAPRSDVSLELGDFDHKRGTIQFGHRLGSSTGFQMSAMGERSGGFRDNYYLHRYGINPSVGVALNDATVLTIAYEHLFDRRLADRGIPSQNGRPVDVDPSHFFGSANQSFSRNVVDTASVVLERRLGRRLFFKNNFLAGRYDKFYQNVYAGSAVGATGTLSLAGYNNGIDRTNTFNQSDFIFNGTMAGMEHTVLFGAEIGHQFQNEKRNTVANITSVPVTSSIRDADFATATVANDRHATSDVLAGYVQDQVAFAPRWKAVFGARTDRFTVNVDDRRPGSTDLTRTDVETSPRAGAIFQPNGNTSIYASYSYTFLPSGQTLGLAANTVDLQPENAKNYEIGAKMDFLENHLNVSTAVFRLDRNNVKNTDPNNPLLLVLTGQQRTDGVSLAASGSVNQRWKLNTGYAYLRARILKDTSSAPAGRHVGLVPASQFTLWSTYALSNQWEVGGGAITQTKQFTSFSNAVVLPGFTRADAAVYYRVGPYRVALNLENLFDTNYYPTAHNDNNISPGSPRTWRLTLRRAW